MPQLGGAAYWLAPPLFCLFLYWLGLKAWFQQDLTAGPAYWERLPVRAGFAAAPRGGRATKPRGFYPGGPHLHPARGRRRTRGDHWDPRNPLRRCERIGRTPRKAGNTACPTWQPNHLAVGGAGGLACQPIHSHLLKLVKLLFALVDMCAREVACRSHHHL